MFRKRINNISKPLPISREEAKHVANQEMHFATTKIDFDHVVKRVSREVANELRRNGPPGIVT